MHRKCSYKPLPAAIPVVIPIENRVGMGSEILTHMSRKGNGAFLATEVSLTPQEFRGKKKGDESDKFLLKLEDPQERQKVFYVPASRVRARERSVALTALFTVVLGLVR